MYVFDGTFGEKDGKKEFLSDYSVSQRAVRFPAPLTGCVYACTASKILPRRSVPVRGRRAPTPLSVRHPCMHVTAYQDRLCYTGGSSSVRSALVRASTPIPLARRPGTPLSPATSGTCQHTQLPTPSSLDMVAAAGAFSTPPPPKRRSRSPASLAIRRQRPGALHVHACPPAS